MPDFLTKISLKVVGMVVGGLILLGLILFAFNQCSKRRSEAAQSRVQSAQAQAASNSAADAVNTIAASGEAQAASEAQTRQNEKDIRNAKGSDAAVDPAARDAGLRALCLRRAYRADPKCRVFQPHP